jgi:membrane protease YdiL (CAAX protease family)
MSGDPPAGPPTPEARGGLVGVVRDLLAIDRRALVILVTVPLVLTILDYYGLPWHHHTRREYRPAQAAGAMRPAPPAAEVVASVPVPGPQAVRHFVWWGAACLFLLVFVPMAGAWFVGRISPRALGLRWRGTGRDAWTYLLIFLVFFPVVYLFSLTPEFQRTYPFYRQTGSVLDHTFVLFEAVYCLQFFAVEFFFRGFITLGLKPVMGRLSILVMLAPYCMIHYYKPFPEAMGSIGAGLVLGALAYRTGTILYGWALHFGVALSMDLLALHHLGRL